MPNDIEPQKVKERVVVLVDGPQMSAIADTLRVEGKRIRPSRLLNYLVGDRELVKAIWYQPIDPTRTGLIEFLLDFVVADRLFDVVIRRGDIDTDLATDFLEFANNQQAETIILITGDGDYTKSIRLVRAKGVKVEVAFTDVWAKTADALRRACGGNFIELAEAEAEILEGT